MFYMSEGQLSVRFPRILTNTVVQLQRSISSVNHAVGVVTTEAIQYFWSTYVTNSMSREEINSLEYVHQTSNETKSPFSSPSGNVAYQLPREDLNLYKWISTCHSKHLCSFPTSTMSLWIYIYQRYLIYALIIPFVSPFQVQNKNSASASNKQTHFWLPCTLTVLFVPLKQPHCQLKGSHLYGVDTSLIFIRHI